MRHKSGPMEIGEIAWDGKEHYDGEWRETQAVGYAKGEARGNGKGKHKDGKG